VLKARQTYEIMNAEDVGWTTNRIVLGKLSGRTAFRQRVQELGIPIETEEELAAAFARFKDLAIARRRSSTRTSRPCFPTRRWFRITSISA